MKILNFKKFWEAISGAELVGDHMGPGYPERVKTKLGDIDRDIVLKDDILKHSDDIYNDWLDYLKSGGKLSFIKWKELI
jgi:hypothetical protein